VIARAVLNKEGSEREEPARLLVDGRRLGSGKPLPFNVAVGGSDLDRPP
jgi:hypothetical protein